MVVKILICFVRQFFDVTNLGQLLVSRLGLKKGVGGERNFPFWVPLLIPGYLSRFFSLIGWQVSPRYQKRDLDLSPHEAKLDPKKGRY